MIHLNRFRDFKYQEALFELMLKQYELARLDEAREGAVMQVVDVAVVPERKSKPRVAAIGVVVLLLSAFSLLIFVLLRHFYRSARQDPVISEKLARIFTHLKQIRP